MAKAKTRRKRRAPRAVSATAEIYDVNWKAAKIIDKSTYKINRRTGLVVTSLVAIGHELNTIKELLPHGVFSTFVDNEFLFSLRKAQIWMNCAAIAAGNSDIIHRFQATVLYKVAAPTTPISVRDRVFADMREGQECPSLDTIKLRIDQARESKLPVRVIDFSGDFPDLDFSLEAEAQRKVPDFELSDAGSKLLSLFIANIPRTEFGETARLLGMIYISDLTKMASKIRFKTLRSEQLRSLDDRYEA